jgi:hypothetical protein
MVARANTCDIAVAMTDFVGHDVDKSSKQLNIPFFRVGGSVSALKRWLGDWLATPPVTGEYSSTGR